jgi:hypothetical protein
MLRGVIRAVILLALLAGLGAGLAWLGRHPPGEPGAPAPAVATPAPASVGSPAGSSQAALATPFGDALFRWRCTTGLKDALGDRPDWPLERIAGLCLCAATRLREDGARDIVIGTGAVAPALEAVEARLCRRG